MLFFVLSSVLAAAAIETPELPPGQYVGDWPLHPIDEAAWTQVEEGFVEAMAPRDIESDPALHILIPAMFADGRYFCGSYVGRLEPSNPDKLFLFVAEILPEGDQGGANAPESRVVLANRTATEADLEHYCPNMGAERRAAIVDPR